MRGEGHPQNCNEEEIQAWLNMRLLESEKVLHEILAVFYYATQERGLSVFLPELEETELMTHIRRLHGEDKES